MHLEKAHLFICVTGHVCYIPIRNNGIRLPALAKGVGPTLSNVQWQPFCHGRKPGRLTASVGRYELSDR